MKKLARTIAMIVLAGAGAIVTMGTYVPSPPPAPHFFDYFGDGSEADPNPAGPITLGGDHSYSNFTLAAGATINLVEDFSTPPSSTLIVRSPGTCTIAGRINGRGAANPVYTIGGAGGGGGGNPTAAGLQALGVISPSLDFSGGAGGGSGTPGANGQDGAPLSDNIKRFVLDDLPSTVDSSGGMPGGAGASAANPFNCHNAQPGNGGCGGGGLVFACKEIDFQATAIVDLRGQDGFAGASGPIGGGGAAEAVFSSPTQSLTSTVPPAAVRC